MSLEKEMLREQTKRKCDAVINELASQRMEYPTKNWRTIITQKDIDMVTNHNENLQKMIDKISNIREVVEIL